MDVALINFVGAGLTVVSSGFGFTVPAGAVRNGYSLVDYLVRHRSPAVKTLLEDVIEDVWRGWRSAKMPRAAAQQHVDGLPLLMESHCPPAAYFVSGLANTGAAKRKPGADAAAPGRSIAAETIMRARAASMFHKAGLNEALCYFLLERLFARLLAEREFFEDLKPALEAYFAGRMWEESTTGAGDDPAMPMTQPVAAPVAVTTPPPLPAASKSRDDSAGADDDPAPAVDGDARDLQLLLAQAAGLRASLRASQHADEPQALRAPNQVRLGQLLVEIGKIEGRVEQLEEAVHCLQAGLQVMRPGADPDLHAQGRLSLGDACAILGEVQDDQFLLAQAVDDLGALCDELSGQSGSKLWVAAYQGLGSALVASALDEQGTETLERAAQAFETALDGLSRKTQPHDWAVTSSQLGSVLWAIGSRRQDEDLIGEAATIKIAALDEFEALGDAGLIETIRDDLMVLQDELQSVTEAGSQAELSRAG